MELSVESFFSSCWIHGWACWIANLKGVVRVWCWCCVKSRGGLSLGLDLGSYVGVSGLFCCGAVRKVWLLALCGIFNVYLWLVINSLKTEMTNGEGVKFRIRRI